MKFLIISDIHDNLINLKKCINWGRGEKIANAICCGDVANGETLKYLVDNFKSIYLVRGNLEIYDETEIKKYNNLNYLNRFGIFEIDGKTVGLCHEPWYIKSVLKIKPCQLIFYGHTHEPWIEKKDGIIMANPGTLGGVFNKACFAVWNSLNNKLELKILDLL
ncbi:YfcE family phosphodiesterase [Patescibacteria group bacterium]|nr:YfcE family phosphodiesterase [Patescibacteria group bacterium]MBU1663026.1 YfcE family phosphodiesterase [Patescibacteria group bacterium]MBU1934165.1 YfcE family phosphodiesterase [Patescibacteria group bacterium]MBU2007550.1 YfcE family phosphodiesterase [Patescibacteria group bacterium]MBU2233498.1 YfcE family phosphodiesterase [Patescibacteria group bacterium]